MSHTLGIDLGSTMARAAVCTADGPRLLAAVPSVVSFPKKGDPVTGEVARRQLYISPSRSCTALLSTIADTQRRVIDGRFYSNVEIVGVLLRELRARAQNAMSQEFRSCVLAVPDSFGWEERRSLREAAAQAGLHVEGFLVESCAAALGSGMLGNGSGRLLVCDAGGGSFKATVLEICEKSVRRISCRSSSDCGGDSFDNCIAAWLLQRFREEHSVDLSRDLNAMQRIMEAAELAKGKLSSDTVTTISLPYITAEKDEALHLDYQLSRSLFYDLSARLIREIALTVEKTLADGAVPRVLLTGGLAAMPAVRQSIGQAVFIPPEQENSTAFGAASAGKYNYVSTEAAMA